MLCWWDPSVDALKGMSRRLGRGGQYSSNDRYTMMKLPKFNPDQLILILVISLFVLGLSLWRYFNLL